MLGENACKHSIGPNLSSSAFLQEAPVGGAKVNPAHLPQAGTRGSSPSHCPCLSSAGCRLLWGLSETSVLFLLLRILFLGVCLKNTSGKGWKTVSPLKCISLSSPLPRGCLSPPGESMTVFPLPSDLAGSQRPGGQARGSPTPPTDYKPSPEGRGKFILSLIGRLVGRTDQRAELRRTLYSAPKWI